MNECESPFMLNYHGCVHVHVVVKFCSFGSVDNYCLFAHQQLWALDFQHTYMYNQHCVYMSLMYANTLSMIHSMDASCCVSF